MRLQGEIIISTEFVRMVMGGRLRKMVVANKSWWRVII